MIAKFGYPKYMPSPYSVYLSNFSTRVQDFLNSAKPFAKYNKQDMEYEVTPDVYAEACTIEPAQEENSLPTEKLYDVFSYKTDYPYQYQDCAVEFSLTHDNLLLNFSQGLGKSFSTMKILAARQRKRVLIITGVSNLQEEWIKDAQKHQIGPGVSYKEALNMQIVGGDSGVSVAKRVAWLSADRSGQEVFTDLISIESCRSEDVISALNALKYDAIVVDEIQAAKGMKAEQTLGVHELLYYPGQIRLALSGTPVLNNPLEYYSILRFLRVLFYKSSVQQCSRTAFNNYYGEWEIVKENVGGWQTVEHRVCVAYRRLDQLQSLVEPVLVHAPKSLLGLPEKHREVVQLPILHPEYDRLKKLYRRGSSAVKRAGYKTIQALAAELQFMTSSDLSKKQFILNHIRLKNRPLVFSQYTTVLDNIKEYLEAEGFTVSYYHGKLTSKQRLAVLEDWKAGNGDVLLLSIACSRYGLNLQETQVSIFLEPPTSPAILEQAEDRLHRIGQTKEVYSYVLLAGASDESDWEIVRKKSNLL